MECLTTTSREVLKEQLALNEQDTDRLMYCISQVRSGIVSLNGLIHEMEISLDISISSSILDRGSSEWILLSLIWVSLWR